MFMYKDGNTYHILSNSNNTITDVLSFSYTNCVWSGTSGSTFSNQGRYLYWTSNNEVWTANTTGDNLTINGNKIYNTYGNYYIYIRYNNSSWVSSTINSQNEVVYAISGPTTASWTTPLSITGNQTTFSNLGSFTYSANAAYRPTYYTLTGNGTYYVVEGGTPSNTIPASSSTGLTFSWSLNDGTNDDGHVRVDSSTGEVTYYNSYASNTNTTIKVTAMHTASGASSSATKTITFNYLPIANPISITATDKTILQGEAWTADNYTLTATDGYQAYQFVIAESSNTSVATVANSTGGFTVTGIETGTATITISAYKQGNTEIACSTTFIVTVSEPETGVSGGTVILNDYEDHRWTYYAGVDASVDGGNYNTNYAGKMYSPNPRNVKITYNGVNSINNSNTRVRVSINENETSFVYYKTLEQGNTSGEYPYQVISNPFSVRPSTGSGNNKVYYGFAGWKIVSGGEYIKNHGNSDVLGLDEEIVFNNLPYPSVNCTSAEIIFETTWKRANRTYVSSNPSNNQTYNTSGDYESNFYVINCNYTRTITTSGPVTIMMAEPDGSADYRNNYSFSGNIAPNNNGITKIEFTKWVSTNTVNAGYRNLWIGRGMTTTNNNLCASLITGTNSTTSTASPQYSIKVESGFYQYFDFYKGHSTYTGATANTSFAVSGSTANAKITMGNDYDRAKGANSTLQFLYGPMLGYSGNFSTRGNRDNTHTLDLAIKSGTIGSTFFIENSNTANYLQGGAGYCMYLSSAGSQTNVGTRNVIIEGGDICSIGGGIDSYNNAPSNNDNPSSTTHYNRLSFNLRIKGGTIHGNVYGGAAKSPGGGNRVMVMTGGQVKGWFAAGCNGTDNDGGQTYGTSYVYIGGKGKVDSEGLIKTLGYANGGNVYAAGAGRQGATTCGEMTFGTNLVIADNSFIERGIYGGGNYGYALASTNLYITGGTNDGKSGTVNNVTTKGGVFGGANQQDGPNINLYMTGGIMKGGVYGGCNTQGTISNNVTMQINGGQVGTTSQTANIHGGGYGQATRVSGNVDLTLGSQNQTTPGVTVYGDVYGGSALGYVNGTAATNTYHTYVTMNKGIINGSMYGGGLGNASTAANVYGPVTVTVNGGTVNTTSANGSGAVYGCNNINGAPQRAVAVIINGTDPAPDEDSYALDAVYGGGNQANYAAGTPTVTVNNCDNSIDYVYGGGNAAHITNGNTDVTIFGGNKIGNVFGGGNGTQTAANVSGNTNVKIYGGTILNVFGGSNSQGTIGGTINVTVDSSQGTGCPMNIGNVYGGGNMAPSNAGNLNIVCTGNGGHIDNIFGGANQADITGDIDLKINGGDIGNVFGGNNQSGEISGNIEVTVGDNPNNCETFKIENVYGGGNLAAYGHGNDYPQVNIVSGEITEGVYGGGYGESAVITGNPQVTVKGGTIGSIYGGGNAAAVTGNTIVSVENAAVTEAIYGGSNAANISGTTTVDVISGTVGSGIYGGCNSEGTVGRDIAVNISGGTIGTSDAKANIHGGGYGSSTATSGNVTVNINGSIIHGDVYGGSALGNVNGSTSNTTMVNLTGGTVYGDAYGGGLGDSSNPAYVNGNVTITLNGTAFVLTTTSDDEGNSIPASGRIFGCNNLNGTPKGTVLVKILKTTPANGATRAKGTYEVQAVYGGGNLAAYDPTDPFAEGQFTEYTYSSVTASHDNTDKPVQVVIDGCEETSIEYAYGGGNAAPTPATDVTVIGCYEIGNVFGGGNGKDKYTLDGGTTWNSNNGADVGYKGSTSYGTGTTLASVYGGTVHYIFGGSNTKGNIRVISEAAIDEASDCPLDVEEIYGGGNEAYMEGDSKISLGCIDFLQEIYGGAKNADVGGDIELTITSGHFDRVFGGNNLGGNIEGSITVNIEETGCNPITIGELYGCGNAAAYTTPSGKTDPTINIKSFTSIGRVFGGGLGEGAVVTGNPTVNINEVVGENASMTPTTVYAGTTRALSDGTTVTLPDHTAGEIGAIGTVFGGGNAAVVNGNTNVYVGTESTITYISVDESSEPIPVVGVDIRGNVYGGGNAADVTGSTNVVIGQ